MFRLALPALAALAFLAQPALAGDACKGIKIKEDKFGTGKSADVVIQGLSQLRMLGLYMQADSGAVTFTVKVKEGGALNGLVAAGTEVMFSFDGGEVVTLATANDAALQSYVAGDVVLTNVPYTFQLTAEQLDKFATVDLVALRVPVISTGTTYDWDANGGVVKKLRSSATCLQSL